MAFYGFEISTVLWGGETFFLAESLVLFKLNKTKAHAYERLRQSEQSRRA